MRHASLLLFFPLLLLMVANMLSCGKKDIFDQEYYRYFVRSNYPVDTLEESHPWTLLRRYWITVTADIDDSDIRELRLYNAHPSLGDGAEMVAQADILTGTTATTSYDVAQTAAGTMYAALVTTGGRTYVAPFTVGQDSVRMTRSQASVMRKMPSTALQTFTYLFESSFPVPEDFDYNDLVLRISRRAPQTNHLQLTVTLVAAGCNKQVAAAIRLPGVDYEQVERVAIEGEEPFDAGYPYMFSKLDVEGNLAKARNGEAVIRLFEDAHWALQKEQTQTGAIAHQPCNTMLFSGSDSVKTYTPVSRTYNIFFKGEANADSLRLDDLDPFVIETTDIINFEVHTYKYKFQEALWVYLGDDKRTYDDYLAWALVIPDPDFRYPIEEIPLGLFRNGELYGAYGRLNHSFGQWGRNYRVAYDWWQYPNKALVY